MDPSFFFGSPGTRLDKIQTMTSHGLTIHNCRDDDDDNGNNLILQCLEHSNYTYYDYVPNLSPRSIKLHHDFHYICFSFKGTSRQQPR